jgi:hypothetical protein
MNHRPSPLHPITRRDLLFLMETALGIAEFRYAQHIAISWLGFFPGDLWVNYLYAQALFLQKQAQSLGDSSQLKQGYSINHGRAIVERMIQVDPEFLEAYQLLEKIEYLSGHEPTPATQAALYILSGKRTSDQNISKGLQSLRNTSQWLSHQNRPMGTWENNALTYALTNQSTAEHTLFNTKKFPLAAVIQARALYLQNGSTGEISQIILDFSNDWPKCVPLKLLLADILMKSNPDEAVDLLHESVALDTAGQVPKRFWGNAYLYQKMWPLDLEVSPGHLSSPQNIPIPASIAAALGWNQLPRSVKKKKQFDRKT